MSSAKKLQVFVSSTYTDLEEERQAAVEAILSAGHIPAGMELFAAGNDSQMTVIRRWIDESDVFLLVLGGRYGSVETTTGKSYTHLEYEYASQTGKPLFAVVLDDAALEERVRSEGRKVLETEHPAELREFRALVLSKVVRFWRDVRDIKLAIHETMGELNRRMDLVGWIPGDQGIQTGLVAEEIARVSRENAELRKQVAEFANGQVTYVGLSYSELKGLLESEVIDVEPYGKSNYDWIQSLPRQLGGTANLLEVLWVFKNDVLSGLLIRWDDPRFDALTRLGFYGVLSQKEVSAGDPAGIFSFRVTEDGRKFILRLMVERSFE